MESIDQLKSRKVRIKSENMREVALLVEQLRQKPMLRYLFVELTNRCNLKCMHCGSSCAPDKGDVLDRDLICRTLQTVADDFGTQQVMICLTGGEPMLHPQFWEIIDFIHKLGFPWGMTSNGTLIQDGEAKRLLQSGMGSISLSLDGLEKSHDALRRTPGSFAKTIRGLRALQALNFPVQITSVIHKKNFSELQELFDLMTELKVDSWRAINIEPIGRALDNSDLLLSREEFFELLRFIREKRFDRNVPFEVCYGCSHYLSFEYEHELRDHYFFCASGLLVGSILSNGDIFSCLDIERRPELIQGNIAADRFSDVWKNRFEAFRADRSELCEECRNCSEKSFCRGDSTHTWDFDRNRPMMCVLRKQW